MTPAEESLIAGIYAPERTSAPWKLEELLPGMELRYFSFGRRALAAALRACGACEGAPVLLPSFICGDVLSALLAVQARPVFYDVGPDLRPMLPPERWPSAAAVLAVDYFGFPQDLEPFRRYCARTRATLIEDAAHALFSRDAEGLLLGTRADLGVLSLRKSLPLPDGAALVFSNPQRGLRPPEQEPFRDGASLRLRFKALLRRTVSATGARGLFRALRLWRGAGALLGAGHPGDAAEECRLPSPERPCAAARGPHLFCAPAQEAARRRALYAFFEGLMRAQGFGPLFASLPEGVVPYAFPLRVPPAREPALRALLAEVCVEPLPWPELPSALSAGAPPHYRDLRLIHFLW